MRRVLLALSLGMLVISSLPAAAWAQRTAAPAERPNIVLIMVDDLGYSDLGSYGATAFNTPHLDGLAAEGLRFTQFYNNAKCVESRATLLSGLYWQQTQNLERENHVTVAEVLQQAGYHTMMVGKWHVADAPSQRGFDRSFGFLNGAINYFTGVGTQGQTDNWRLNGEPYDVPEEDFYATHAFTDYATQFVEEAADGAQPFFLYLAYNAPHYPLQAPEETIQKYRQAFMGGWDRLREVRHARQLEMGLLPEKWALPPRNATPAPQYPRIPAWEELSMERKWSEDLKMATYAAMVEEMDRGVGRLMDRLEQLDEAENTLVLFLSDNGGCPFPKTRTPLVPPGPAESFHNYDTPWAHLSNTPFRGYKRQAFEGGAATPLLVHWPAVIAGARQGTLTRQRGHIIDLMPTLLEAAGARYPDRYDGHDVLAAEGTSLLSVVRGEEPTDRGPMFWEYARHAAVRQDQWKLVALRDRPWELYDMRADRTEMHDLSDEKPQKRDALIRMYTRWAERVGAAFPQKQE